VSIAKVAIIAGIALTLSMIGVVVVFLTSQATSQSQQIDNEGTTGTNGKHFDLQLKESMNVKSSP